MSDGEVHPRHSPPGQRMSPRKAPCQRAAGALLFAVCPFMAAGSSTLVAGRRKSPFPGALETGAVCRGLVLTCSAAFHAFFSVHNAGAVTGKTRLRLQVNKPASLA